jgi:hypothetical protein
VYPIKQSTAIDVLFFLHDSNGDPLTGKVDGDFTKQISKNGGAFGAMTVTITERAGGWYLLPLGTGHTDTLGILSVYLTASGAKQVNLQYRVHVRVYDDLAFPTTSGRSIDVTTGGGVGIDWGNVENQSTAVTLSGTTVDELTTVGVGAIVGVSFANGAIDAAALNADAVTEIRSVVSGTADDGSTTTVIDAARTEADADYWKGNFLLFTSGTIAGQCRLITAFDEGTDTLTFAPATTQAVSTQTYEILPAARVDLQLWLGSVANALVSGRVDASVGAMASNTVTAAALATDAVNEVRDSILSDSTPFAGGNINATISSRATPAQVNAEVLDVLTADTFVEVSAVPAASSTILDKLNWLFGLARNKILQTATTQTLRNDADDGTIATAAVSDDGTTFTRAEWS